VHVICFAFSLSVMAGSGAGQTGQSSCEKATILELNKQWHELGVKRDVAAFD